MYIAKAYVKCDKEKWAYMCSMIPNRKVSFSARNCLGGYLAFNEALVRGTDNYPLLTGIIDCNAYTPNGTEEEAVRLFLILAEMREKVATNSFVQWNDSIYLPKLTTIPVILKDSITRIMAMIDCDEKLYHRLSPLEVAEAFKNGIIQL